MLHSDILPEHSCTGELIELREQSIRECGLASESHLIANRTVIAMLALCTLGMAFLFRIIIVVLVNQRLKGSAGEQRV
jgi:hypothetical protein